MNLRCEIPQGFSEETRWFKFLSQRSLVVMLVVAAPGFVFLKLFSSMGLTVQYIVLWAFAVLFITALTMVKMPNTRWMEGGGEYIDQLLLKRTIRKKNRCLYIKGYHQLKYEEEERKKE